MEDYCVPYDPKSAEKEKKKKEAEEEKKFWRKAAIILAALGILFFYGLFSVGFREPYTREWKFQPDSMSPNIKSLNLTAGGFAIDYSVGGDSYSTSDDDSYPVEVSKENNASIESMLAQKYDGHFYDADFNYESGIMNVTEGVIVKEEVHYYTDQAYCGTGYHVFETGKYKVDKDNTVTTTFTPSVINYLGAFGIFLLIIVLGIFFSSGEAEVGRGC